MTPSSTQCLPNQLQFGSIKGRKVIANFSGGRITSDAGIVLLAELDKKLKITEKFAKCFRDYRDSSYVQSTPLIRRKYCFLTHLRLTFHGISETPSRTGFPPKAYFQ